RIRLAREILVLIAIRTHAARVRRGGRSCNAQLRKCPVGGLSPVFAGDRRVTSPPAAGTGGHLKGWCGQFGRGWLCFFWRAVAGAVGLRRGRLAVFGPIFEAHRHALGDARFLHGDRTSATAIVRFSPLLMSEMLR